MRKFLIIRLSSIGDIVLTSPVVRCLRKRYPDAEIHFCTKTGYEDIVRHNPYLNKIHLFDGNLSALIRSLKAEHFDFVIDLHKNIRSHIIRYSLRLPSATFQKLNFRKWLFVRFKLDLMPKVHIVERYFSAVSKLDVAYDSGGLDYFLLPTGDEVLSKLPQKHQNGFIAVAIGGKHKTKMLPVEKLISVCQLLNEPVVLLGGTEDYNSGTEIVNAAGDIVFNACGSFSLLESASLLKPAKVVITHDTGLMHIAAALRRPVVSVWGNTVPEFGMTPFYPDNLKGLFAVFQVSGLKCRPCSKLGYETCPQKHFNCMNQQSEAAIAQSANQFASSGF
ncbi:MAG TPA: glycosyltransferase family 9 protein [Bacteroidales bacterium]|nr:glycosyltransferase family 9 protein [Bacteroidales bacterium]